MIKIQLNAVWAVVTDTTTAEMTAMNVQNIARDALTVVSAATVTLVSTVLIAKPHALQTAKVKHATKFLDIAHKVALTDIIKMGITVTNARTNV